MEVNSSNPEEKGAEAKKYKFTIPIMVETDVIMQG
jgi:hypothetical protein